jgi:hypothetical protein
VTQGAQKLRLTEVLIADGSFVLNAGGEVDLIDVRSRSNADSNDITVTAAADVMVRYVSAGVYATGAGDAPVIVNSNGQVQAYTSLSSLGDVSLTSTTGRVYEVFVDDAVDVVADTLTVRAATGITGLETALNTLDAKTTTGDIELSERDGYLEKTAGLDVLFAEITTPAVNSDDVTLTAQRDLERHVSRAVPRPPSGFHQGHARSQRPSIASRIFLEADLRSSAYSCAAGSTRMAVSATCVSSKAALASSRRRSDSWSCQRSLDINAQRRMPFQKRNGKRAAPSARKIQVRGTPAVRQAAASAARISPWTDSVFKNHSHP